MIIPFIPPPNNSTNYITNVVFFFIRDSSGEVFITGCINNTPSIIIKNKISSYFYGKMVFSKIREIENEEISIKDTNLKPGQYIIHINNGSSSQKEIIIIE